MWVQAADPSPEGNSLSATVSQLHVALAKKNAEVEQLRSSLAMMQESSQNMPWQAEKTVDDSETIFMAQECVDILSYLSISTLQRCPLRWEAESPGAMIPLT
jgi:hypothetical protein